MTGFIETVLGFSGTRHGMSAGQHATFCKLLSALRPSELVHGDCVGADKQAHEAMRWMFPSCRIMVRPGLNDTGRAYCDGNHIYNSQGFMARNKAIAKQCHVLIATPMQDDEVLRSGTWSTIRAAIKLDRTVFHILRDGTVKVY